MNAIRNTFLELLLIGMLGVGTALAYNAIRNDGRLRLTKNYFDRRTARSGANRVAPAQGSLAKGLPDAAGSATCAETGEPARADQKPTQPTPPPTVVVAAKPPPDKPNEGHPVHDYKEMHFEELRALVDDPETASGLNLVIDARNDELFLGGHIPGAVLCNPYEVEKYAESIKDVALGAAKIIVYCGGGDCEDSIFLCRELIDMDVAEDALYLYPGGWKDWVQRQGPIATGAD